MVRHTLKLLQHFLQNFKVCLTILGHYALILIRVGFLVVRFEVGGGKVIPCLKLVRIMPETSNLARKYTLICSFRKYTF